MPIKILIVDDSAIMRKIIEKTVNSCGIDSACIFEAKNGQEGLDLLAANDMDILLIDINMPVMNGIQMLKRVKNNEQTKDLPVLIISAESNKKRIHEIARYGAKFIHKPFAPEKLRREMMGIIKKEKYFLSASNV